MRRNGPTDAGLANDEGRPTMLVASGFRMDLFRMDLFLAVGTCPIVSRLVADGRCGVAVLAPNSCGLDFFPAERTLAHGRYLIHCEVF